ncbi:MAG: PLDc N-terminal domain-containing protein [Desulfobacterales bacterium]
MDLKAAVTFVILCIPFFLLTVWALVDVLMKDFGSTGKKALWAVVAGVPFIGALIYLALGFRRGRKPGRA